MLKLKFKKNEGDQGDQGDQGSLSFRSLSAPVSSASLRPSRPSLPPSGAVSGDRVQHGAALDPPAPAVDCDCDCDCDLDLGRNRDYRPVSIMVLSHEVAEVFDKIRRLSPSLDPVAIVSSAVARGEWIQTREKKGVVMVTWNTKYTSSRAHETKDAMCGRCFFGSLCGVYPGHPYCEFNEFDNNNSNSEEN